MEKARRAHFVAALQQAQDALQHAVVIDSESLRSSMLALGDAIGKAAEAGFQPEELALPREVTMAAPVQAANGDLGRAADAVRRTVASAPEGMDRLPAEIDVLQRAIARGSGIGLAPECWRQLWRSVGWRSGRLQ